MCWSDLREVEHVDDEASSDYRGDMDNEETRHIRDIREFVLETAIELVTQFESREEARVFEHNLSIVLDAAYGSPTMGVPRPKPGSVEG